MLLRHQRLAPRGSESKIVECPRLESRVHIEQVCFARAKREICKPYLPKPHATHSQWGLLSSKQFQHTRAEMRRISDNDHASVLELIFNKN